MSSPIPSTPPPTGHFPSPDAKSPLAFLQPFGNDVCESWHDADGQSSAPIHEEALSALRSLESEGRIVLLSAPRAGHGKTHLLGRVAAKLQPGSTVAALPWETQQGLSWHATAQGILQDLATSRQGADPQLADLCRGVLAMLLKRLVQTGKVPSANPGQALQLLQNHPNALFSRDGEAKALAKWFHTHFQTLRKSMALISGLPPSPWIEAWLQRFMLASSPALHTAETLDILLQGLPQNHQTNAENSAACLLRLMCSWKPMVLVADHMDGLYRDIEAGMSLARMALALSTLPRVRVVLSMNQDLWDTTLGRQLPSAIQDRLNASNITLQGLDLVEAHALVLLRLKEARVSASDSRNFMQFADLESYFATRNHGTVAPRELLRHAARRWYRWLHPEPEPASAQIDFSSKTDPISDNETSAEDLERLKLALEQDMDGTHVDLSTYPANLEKAPTGVVPMPTENEIPWQGSFLVMDDAEANEEPAPPETTPETTPEAEAAPPPVNEPTIEPPPPAAEPPPAETVAIAPPPPPPPPKPVGALKRLGEMMAKFRHHNHEAAPAAPLSPTTLRDRFEDERAKAHHLQPGYLWLRDIVNLAGEHSALIKLDHIELPGFSAQRIPRWTWAGAEVIFAIATIDQEQDWRLISSYIAGRLAEFNNASTQYHEPCPDFKWVTLFQNDAEAAKFQQYQDSGVIPDTLESCLDRVQFSEPQLADLLALWQLAQNPDITSRADMVSAWQDLLADRLDFFWRRLTRPLKTTAA